MFSRILDLVSAGLGRESNPPLQVGIFRLICATTAVLCLGLVLPMNLLQNMPLAVNIDTVLFGLLGGYCYWASSRGRQRFGMFFGAAVLMMDVAWFWNAGSLGSVTYFFFPLMVFAVAMFRGTWRWLLAAVVVLNVGTLFILEWLHPELVIGFSTPLDRLLDHLTGLIAGFAAVAVIVWLMLAGYNREQARISRIAAQLEVSEKNYREIFNSTGDALLVHRVDGSLVDVNAQACELYRLERAAILARSGDERSLGKSPYSGAEAISYIEATLRQGPQIFEWRSRRGDGEWFWSEVSLRAGEIAGEQRVIATVRDISQRKRSEEMLRENEERLRLAMQASRQGWFEMNVQTGEGVSSPEYVRIIGYDPESFKTTRETWLDGVHPEDRASVLRAYGQCIAAGETGTLEYRRQAKGGGWKWIRSVGRIVEYDAAGRPLRMCGTHADITERKELEAQLSRSQRLEAVGTLASGVAHDLNNILTPVLMASGILRERLTDPLDRELMTMLDSGGRRGAAIVRQLLAFSRNLAQERVKVDPRQLVRDAVAMVRPTLPPGISLVVSATEELGPLQADAGQLQQVIVNLCANARDAMPGGGTITIGLGRNVLPPPCPGEVGAPAGGPYVVLSVADSGCGIAPEIQDRIFDPFFTTKAPGQGTGLGLATVFGVVKAHGGFVRVESAPGCGAVFQVHLPVAAPAAREEGGTDPSAEGKRRREGCLLLVDDDTAVLEATRRRLVLEGYRVLTAGDGRTALAQLRQAGADVQVVITDFSMPEMDGPALVPLLREIVPGLRIIGMSGRNHDGRAAELAALGFAEILQKPYTSGDLLSAIERQLSAGAASG